MDAVLFAYEKGRIPGILPVVAISSRQDAGGIAKAHAHNILPVVVERKGKTREEFGDKLLAVLEENKVDLVSQNGWLPFTPDQVVDAYKGKIINQHPGPNDPGRKMDFGGKGMHGRAPHCARIAYLWMSGERPYTESDIHFTTSEVDGGDLISVVEMPLPGFDFVITPEDILRDQYQQELIRRTGESQAALLPLEHKNVIDTLRRFGSGEGANGYRREKPLVPEQNYSILELSKTIAVKLYPDG